MTAILINDELSYFSNNQIYAEDRIGAENIMKEFVMIVKAWGSEEDEIAYVMTRKNYHIGYLIINGTALKVSFVDHNNVCNVKTIHSLLIK